MQQGSQSCWGAVLLTTVLVVHSWRWILFATFLLAIAFVGFCIEHMDDMNDGVGLPGDPEPAKLHKPSADVWQNLPRF
jgi:hypothetical protein